MFDWLKQTELAERLVRAEEAKAAALARLAQLAELALGVDPASVARAAEATIPQPEGTVVFEAEDQAFFEELKQITIDLARTTGGTPSYDAVLREYDVRHSQVPTVGVD